MTLDDKLKVIERDLSVIANRMNRSREFAAAKSAQDALGATVNLHHRLKLGQLDQLDWRSK